jgi:type IV pilus assembly protein PilE
MKSQSGFTLLELMIVVAVIALLALVALPSYSEYIRKGKRSDGARAISEIQLGLERYRADCASYASSATCLDYNRDGDALDAGETYPAATSSYYTIAVSGQSATGYTITATPKSTFVDTNCGNLSVTFNAGVTTRAETGSKDVAYCWRN